MRERDQARLRAERVKAIPGLPLCGGGVGERDGSGVTRVFSGGRIHITGEGLGGGEPAVCGEVEWIEREGLGEERDHFGVLAGLRELRGPVPERRERARAVGLLQPDLRDAPIAAGRGRELLAEVLKLLLRLREAPSLQLAQPGGERDLVIEVLSGRHRA